MVSEKGLVVLTDAEWSVVAALVKRFARHDAEDVAGSMIKIGSTRVVAEKRLLELASMVEGGAKDFERLRGEDMAREREQSRKEQILKFDNRPGVW